MKATILKESQAGFGVAENVSQTARRVLRTVKVGALATLWNDRKFPFVSLVNVAAAMDGSPLLLLSNLARHSRHIAGNSNVSLLLAEKSKGDALAHPRLTLMGNVRQVMDPGLKARFLRWHPKARLYAGFADFSLFRIEMEEAHFNGGFARAGALQRDDILTSLAGADEILAKENDMVADANSRNAAAIEAWGSVILKRPGRWRLAGIHPEGCELALRDNIALLSFDRRARTLQDVQDMFVDLSARCGVRYR